MNSVTVTFLFPVFLINCKQNSFKHLSSIQVKMCIIISTTMVVVMEFNMGGHSKNSILYSI